MEHYRTIREYAKKAKQWPKFRSKLMKVAKIKGGSELIRIHLDEGEIAEALAVLRAEENKNKSFSRYYRSSVGLEVAESAEKSFPEDAIEIYRAEIASLIDARGRSNYQTACRHLRKVKKLYSELGRKNDWKIYMPTCRGAPESREHGNFL